MGSRFILSGAAETLDFELRARDLLDSLLRPLLGARDSTGVREGDNVQRFKKLTSRRNDAVSQIREYKNDLLESVAAAKVTGVPHPVSWTLSKT